VRDVFEQAVAKQSDREFSRLLLKLSQEDRVNLIASMLEKARRPLRKALKNA